MSRRVETPTLLQSQADESGAAALGIVLRYYGSYPPLEELCYVCGVSSGGSRPRDIVRAARSYGLDAHGERRDFAALRKLPMPQILLWNRSQFVVLEGIGGRTISINDPATGARTVSRKEFDAAYGGVALSLQPGASFQRSGQSFGARRALGERLSGLRRAILLLLLVSLFLVVPGVVVPSLLRVFVDDILTDGEKWLSPLLIGMGITALVSAVLAWLQRMALVRMEVVVTARASTRFMWQMLRLPVALVGQRSGGDLAARAELEERTARLLSGDLALASVNVLVLPVYALVMLQYSVLLTVIGVLFALFNLFVLYYIAHRRDTARLALHERTRLASTLMNDVRAIESYKAIGAENDLFARWAGLQARVAAFERQLHYSSHLLSAISVFLFAMNAAIVLIAGGGLVLQGALTVGMLVAFQSLMVSFSYPIWRLLGLASRWQEAESALELAEETLANPTEPMRTDTDEPGGLSGQIDIQNLSFGYSPTQSPFIEDFSLSLQPGRRVAIVGAPGSGKTTVARLIAGLYAPWRGEILLDGQPSSAIPDAVIRRSVALVDQDFAFFSGTVQENLTLWDEYAALTDIWRAAKDADIHETILHRPGGYEYMVEEGGRNFSASERQRLTIARALVSNPTLLILDEATRTLDAAGETRLMENLGWRGCACLFITQRVSAIRDCDEIIVLDAGKIVERGTHEELTALDGLYAHMLAAETAASQPADSPYSRLIPAWLQTPGMSAAAAPARAERVAHPLPSAPLSGIGLLRFGLGASRGLLVVLIVVGLLGGLLGLALPLLTGIVIDRALPGGDRELLQVVGLVLALAALGLALFQWLRGAAAVRVQAKLDTRLQTALFDRLLNQRASFFRGFTTGDLVERALGVSPAKWALADSMALSPLAALFALTSLALLVYYDVVIALVAAVLIAIFLVLTYILGGFGLSLARIHAELRGESSGLVFQLLSGLSKLRAAGAESRAFGVWLRLFEWQQRQKFKTRRAQNPAHMLIAAYPILASLVIFALVYARRTLTLGEFVGFNLAFTQLNLAAAQFGAGLIALRHAAPQVARMQPILLSAPEVDAGRQAPNELSGAITVQNVSFGYADDQPLVLSDLSFRVEPGEFVAVVGASGSGKSTLLRLLIGFEQPGAGEIYYDDQPLSRLDTQALRRQIGVVLQESRLLDGDILSNIAGTHDLTPDDALRAARLAGIADDILRLPLGLRTSVGANGAPLSSAQRQRLMIARALAARPRLLLLDEPGGALDAPAQTQLMNTLRSIHATRIVVAHRLSTAAAADRILVLHEGRIVESGTYAHLTQGGSRFSALAQLR